MLKWIAQYDTKTGERLGKYKSVREASEMTGLNQNSINDVLSGKAKTLFGYSFKREEISRSTLKEKELLTLEEYIWFHKLNNKQFAEIIGVSATCVSYYLNKKSRPNNEVKKKLDSMKIISKWDIVYPSKEKKKHLTKGKKPGLRMYVNNAESISIIARIVCKNKNGKIFCVSKSEANFVSEILTSHGVANYVGITKARELFVKYDRSLKEEIA